MAMPYLGERAGALPQHSVDVDSTAQSQHNAKAH